MLLVRESILPSMPPQDYSIEKGRSIAFVLVPGAGWDLEHRRGQRPDGSGSQRRTNDTRSRRSERKSTVMSEFAF